MSLPEVEMNVQPGADPDEPPARLVHARQSRHHLDQGFHALVLALERAQSHRVLEDAGHEVVQERPPPGLNDDPLGFDDAVKHALDLT